MPPTLTFINAAFFHAVYVLFLTQTVITFLNIIKQFFFLVGCEYLPCCGNGSFEIPASKFYIQVKLKFLTQINLASQVLSLLIKMLN